MATALVNMPAAPIEKGLASKPASSSPTSRAPSASAPDSRAVAGWGRRASPGWGSAIAAFSAQPVG
jgi:hypothetical protein